MPVSIQGVRNRAGNQKHRGLCPDGTDILFAGRAGKYLQSGIKKTKWANGGERTRDQTGCSLRGGVSVVLSVEKH